MFLWRNKQNYLLIIIKYPPYLFHCLQSSPFNWHLLTTIHARLKLLINMIKIQYSTLTCFLGFYILREKEMSRAMRKCVMSYANNKGADQPAHPHSLISAFVVRCLDCIISLDSIAEISILASFCGCAGRFLSYLVANSWRHVLSCRGSNVLDYSKV